MEDESEVNGTTKWNGMCQGPIPDLTSSAYTRERTFAMNTVYLQDMVSLSLGRHLLEWFGLGPGVFSVA